MKGRFTTCNESSPDPGGRKFRARRPTGFAGSTPPIEVPFVPERLPVEGDAIHRRHNVYKYPDKSPEERMMPQQIRAKGKESSSMDSSDELSFSVSSGGGSSNDWTRSRSPGLHLGSFLSRFRQRTMSESTNDGTPLDSGISEMSSALSSKMNIVSEESASEDSGCSDLRKAFPDEDDMDISPQSRLRSRSEASRDELTLYSSVRRLNKTNSDATRKGYDRLMRISRLTCHYPMGKTMLGIADTSSSYVEHAATKTLKRIRKVDDVFLFQQFLVLRKMSRPNAAEIVGRLDVGEKPVLKILSMFTCYDLMGKQSSVVVIDSHLTTRQALGALLSNSALSALVWDDERHATVNVMTITDLLGVMLANNDDLLSWLDCQLKQWIFDPPKGSAGPRTSALTCVSAREKVLNAVETLCRFRLHRIPVIDPETKNVLFMLTLRNVLHFLHKYLSSLPLPKEMYRPIDQWEIGTWTGIRYVRMNSVVNDALDQLLKYNISSMPIVTMEKDEGDEEEHPIVVDILTKVDIVNYIAKHGWRNLSELMVEEIVTDRHRTVEQLVTCHRSTPLLLAVDHMVRHGAHRLIVVGSKSHLVGVISIADLLCSLVPTLSCGRRMGCKYSEADVAVCQEN